MPRTLKSLKTPLRYPGGKSRAIVKLLQYLPDLSQVKEFREPFLGGGSVALEITKRYPKIEIWVNDLYEPLANFWQTLQHDGEKLQNELFKIKKEYHSPDLARDIFTRSKEYLSDQETEDFRRAVSFYIVNKCSFSGLTESSSFSKQASESNFSINGIDRLMEYSELIEGWRITNDTYESLLTDQKDVFVYLDPPYDIKIPIYGKRGSMHKHFDHDKFANDCDNHTAPMLISYNSSQVVRDRFKDWNAAEFDHTYSMRTVGDYMREQQDRKELVLLNYTS
ncbi:MAG: DNA adenine methylase [Verrucomicrobiales bacterium]|nr:DNA adenine methylase [Verrucomicrobiales bacterium]|tara:strand:- start:696 stop:1535 length:840 start_codon:yes stop_codon:yes gene_type:complete